MRPDEFASWNPPFSFHVHEVPVVPLCVVFLPSGVPLWLGPFFSSVANLIHIVLPILVEFIGKRFNTFPSIGAIFQEIFLVVDGRSSDRVSAGIISLGDQMMRGDELRIVGIFRRFM